MEASRGTYIENDVGRVLGNMSLATFRCLCESHAVPDQRKATVHPRSFSLTSALEDLGRSLCMH